MVCLYKKIVDGTLLNRIVICSSLLLGTSIDISFLHLYNRKGLFKYGVGRVAGALLGLQNRVRGACRLWWVRFPHGPANVRFSVFLYIKVLHGLQGKNLLNRLSPLSETDMTFTLSRLL